MSKREPRKRPLEGEDDEPVINKRYMVEKEIDGKEEKLKLAAIVVTSEIRCNEFIDDPEEMEKKKQPMYYVHYESYDRRNDEWITKDKILLKEPVELPPTNTINVPEDVKKEGGGASGPTTGALTRSQRRELEEFAHLKTNINDMDATTARLEREHEERTKIKNVPRITMGKHTISSWYYSPFPASCQNHELYMCEYCLLYSPSKEKFRVHYKACQKRQPPGNEIYRKDNVSIFEIDGTQEKLYCQCLCLLSKLFMDHKTLYFDVDDFMFYVLCEVDDKGAHIVGYFSREVESNNNLACIMVFPPFQRKGYGKLLIQLSYCISEREGYVGTPEKPLSDLGRVSYRSYWWWKLLEHLTIHQGHTVTASFLSSQCGLAVDDIVSTLFTMRMVRQYRVTEPEFVPGEWYVRIHRKIVEHCGTLDFGKPPSLILDKSQVRWRPIQTRAQFHEQNKPARSERRASKSQSVTPLPTPPIDFSRSSLNFVSEDVESSSSTVNSPYYEESGLLL